MLIDWQQAPLTHSIREDAPRRVVSGAHISVVRVVTAPTARFDRVQHRHVNEQWLVVTSGTLRVICAGEEVEVGPGDVVYFPSESPHAAVGVGAEGAEYLEFSAPPRFDLLPGSVVPTPLGYDRDGAAGRPGERAC